MSKKPTWERTSVQNLLRKGASERYYARWSFTVNGKEKQRWVNVKIDVFSVAKLRIHDDAVKIESVRRSGTAVTRSALCSSNRGLRLQSVRLGAVRPGNATVRNFPVAVHGTSYTSIKAIPPFRFEPRRCAV